MQHVLDVENIKCGGCAHSIVSKLSSIKGVDQVDIDIEQGQVRFECPENCLSEVKTELLKMGYPEKGSVEGLASAGAKAKSFVSCAIGKVTKE